MHRHPSTDNLFFTGKDCLHISCRDDVFRRQGGQTADPSGRIDQLLEFHAIPSLQVDLTTDDVLSAQTQFRDELTESSMKKLLITGGLLECAVTQISLTSLLDGYFVFIVKDLVQSGDPSNERYFFDRLTQRGADVVTLAQIEWEMRYLASSSL